MPLQFPFIRGCIFLYLGEEAGPAERPKLSDGGPPSSDYGVTSPREAWIATTTLTPPLDTAHGCGVNSKLIAF
jgi:hypothetical protein